jgi:hypothetical protein
MIINGICIFKYDPQQLRNLELYNMFLKFYKTSWKWLTGVLVLSVAMNFSTSSSAQRSGDIIRIGAPSEWNQYESYWKQLIKDRDKRPLEEVTGKTENNLTPNEADSKVLEEALIKNLRVSDLRLVPIIKLNGSSLVTGKIRNNNTKAITVYSINLEVLDSFGNLVQTSAPSPEPSTIGPGQTVTFQRELYTVPFDSGYQVRLSRNNPFSINSGS